MSDANLTEVGRVVARRGAILDVTVTPGDACAKCGLCRRADDGTMRVEVADVPSIKVGQAVRVVFPYASHWRAIFFVFVLPLGLFFGGALAAAAAAKVLGLTGPPAALAALLCGVAAMGAGFLAGRSADRRFRRTLIERTRIEPLDDSGTAQ